MATTITAGNATNGLAFSADNTGAFEFKTGTGAGTTAMSISATGNVSGVLKSGTAVTASGTSIEFTNIPSTAKRITVMINGLSYAAAGVGLIQIGSGSLTTTGYTSNIIAFTTTPTITVANQTAGFGALSTSAAASTINGMFIITNVTGNTWSFSQQIFRTTDNAAAIGNGFIALSGALDRLSLVATTSTFDAGSINILYE